MHRSAMVNTWKSDDSFEDWVLSIFMGPRDWTLMTSLIWQVPLPDEFIYWHAQWILLSLSTAVPLADSSKRCLRNCEVWDSPWGQKGTLKGLGPYAGGLLTLDDHLYMMFRFKSHVSGAWEHTWNSGMWKAEAEASKVQCQSGLHYETEKPNKTICLSDF